MTRNKSKSKEFSWENVPFVPGEIKILNLLLEIREGATQKTLCKRTKLTIGAISKDMDRLINKGLIYLIKSPIKIYKIIPERISEVEKFVTSFNLGKTKEIIDGHNFVFICEVNELPEKLLNKLKENEDWIEFIPNNWHGIRRAYLDGSVKFHKTSKGCRIIFYFRTFGTDPYIVDAVNTEKFLDKKRLLEDKYEGLKIGTPDLVAKCPFQEVAIIRDPYSVKAIKLGFKHKSLEDSHKVGGEWEEKGPEAVEKIRRIIALRVKETEDLSDKKDICPLE